MTTTSASSAPQPGPLGPPYVGERAPLRRELLSGHVEPGTDDAECRRCGVQALLYVVDVDGQQWFTCLDHHGYVMADLIRGKFDRQRPPLPPLS